MKTELHRRKCASVRRAADTATRAKKKKRTDQLSVNRSVVRGERVVVRRGLGALGDPRSHISAFMGLHLEIFAIAFCFALAQKR